MHAPALPLARPGPCPAPCAAAVPSAPLCATCAPPACHCMVLRGHCMLTVCSPLGHHMPCVRLQLAQSALLAHRMPAVCPLSGRGTSSVCPLLAHHTPLHPCVPIVHLPVPAFPACSCPLPGSRGTICCPFPARSLPPVAIFPACCHLQRQNVLPIPCLLPVSGGSVAMPTPMPIPCSMPTAGCSWP